MARLGTLIVSAVFVVIGIVAIASGDSVGWGITGFFSACFVVAVFEPRLTQRRLSIGQYRLAITAEGIACEHGRRKHEAVQWRDIVRIWYVTTADGPRLPDEWLLLEGEHGGCSFPTEAVGMDALWDELEARFPAFDFGPLI